MQRSGVADLPKPYTPGFEGVGRIISAPVGSSFAKDERIAWINARGSYAERALVPISQAIRIPESFSTAQALLFQGVTAQYLIREYRSVRPGDVALVHSAAGGVGQILVQWLKHLGAIVVATASSGRKLETARSLGADHLVNYVEADFSDVVRRITQGRGVDIAYDAVGQATLERTIACLAQRGTAVTYGSASGPPPAILATSLVQDSKRLAGGRVFTYIADTEEMHVRCAKLIEGIEPGWLRIDDGTGYPLCNAALAHCDIEGRRTEGKLYLLPRANA